MLFLPALRCWWLWIVVDHRIPPYVTAPALLVRQGMDVGAEQTRRLLRVGLRRAPGVGLGGWGEWVAFHAILHSMRWLNVYCFAINLAGWV
jgi:hypothetical protein